MTLRSSDDDALLLLRLAEADGGRADPQRLLTRPKHSSSRLAYEHAQKRGWLDVNGWVTVQGMKALQEWDEIEEVNRAKSSTPRPAPDFPSSAPLRVGTRALSRLRRLRRRA